MTSSGTSSRPPLHSLADEILLAACAVIFLVAYTYEILAEPSGTALLWTEIVLWGTWAAFAVEWLYSFVRDRHKRAHLREHLFGLLVVVLPMFAPLRALRLLSLFVFLQRLLVRSPLRVTVVWYAVASSSLLVYVSALAVLQVEKDLPDSAITTLGDALWWAVATVTTVGYGDITPASGSGKLVAVVLMVSGIALLGIVTATLASWLVERIAEESERSETAELDALTATRDEILAEIRSLRDEVAELRRDRGPA